MARILVVDDEDPIRKVLTTVLEANGHEAFECGDGNAAIEMIKQESFDLVLCDIRMEPVDGIEVLRQTLAAKPYQKVIMLTAYASVDTAEEAMGLGAYNYLTKPWKLDELLNNIQRALDGESHISADEVMVPEDVSPALWEGQPWHDDADSIAHSSSPTLIYSETLDCVAIARSIHDHSDRSDGPFRMLRCATLPEPILIIEMTGCVKGAVETVPDGSPGVVESASGGTLVLDEVAWMPHKIQEAFMEIVNHGALRRVGGLEDIPIDIRVLATTNKDPAALVANSSLTPELHSYFSENIVHLADA